ncbi:CoA transferase [Shinella sp. BYT-45]|uniref:CoA transferase n=1 Tax=Shinella sp. BYT-45 TaxID=3377377 RepID=UPI00397FE3E8
MLLKNVRILEWNSGSITAAFCARLLADLNGEVLKLEEPGGDALRTYGPLLTLPDGRQVGALFSYLNSGKQIVAVDGGTNNIEVLRRLAAGVDILVLSADMTDALAQAVEDLRKRHLGLVVTQISPFGRTYARADIGSFSSDMVMQHRGGFAYEHARPVEDPPHQPPVAGADRELPLAAGIAAAAACVSGLIAARRDPGAAPYIDFSKFDFTAQLNIDAFCAAQRGETAFGRKRLSSAGIEVAGGLIWILQCSDGWAMISPREQHQWERWVDVIGHPAWTDDAALCGDKVVRRQNSEDIQQRLSEWSRSRTKAEVFRLAQDGRVPCFPLSTASDLLKNEQLAHRGFFNAIATADKGDVPVPGLPFHLTTSAGRSLEKRRILNIPEPLKRMLDAVE